MFPVLTVVFERVQAFRRGRFADDFNRRVRGLGADIADCNSIMALPDLNERTAEFVSFANAARSSSFLDDDARTAIDENIGRIRTMMALQTFRLGMDSAMAEAAESGTDEDAIRIARAIVGVRDDARNKINDTPKP